MKFDKNQHQKVRYAGQLYVVILSEFPSYHNEPDSFPVVLHPIGNEWIVQITNPAVRIHMTVKKGSLTKVPPETMS
jgi:hypothetical protein